MTFSFPLFTVKGKIIEVINFPFFFFFSSLVVRFDFAVFLQKKVETTSLSFPKFTHTYMGRFIRLFGSTETGNKYPSFERGMSVALLHFY
jgi:hypothetical protein